MTYTFYHKMGTLHILKSHVKSRILLLYSRTRSVFTIINMLLLYVNRLFSWYWRHYPFVFFLSSQNSFSILQLTIHFNFISLLCHTMMVPQNLLKCKIRSRGKMVRWKWDIVPECTKSTAVKWNWWQNESLKPYRTNWKPFAVPCAATFYLGFRSACLQEYIYEWPRMESLSSDRQTFFIGN